MVAHRGNVSALRLLLDWHVEEASCRKWIVHRCAEAWCQAVLGAPKRDGVLAQSVAQSLQLWSLQLWCEFCRSCDEA